MTTRHDEHPAQLRYKGWAKRALREQIARLEARINDLEYAPRRGFIVTRLFPGAYRIYDRDGREHPVGTLLLKEGDSLNITADLAEDGDEITIRKGTTERPVLLPFKSEHIGHVNAVAQAFDWLRDQYGGTGGQHLQNLFTRAEQIALGVPPDQVDWFLNKGDEPATPIGEGPGSRLSAGFLPKPIAAFDMDTTPTSMPKHQYKRPSGGHTSGCAVQGCGNGPTHVVHQP